MDKGKEGGKKRESQVTVGKQGYQTRKELLKEEGSTE
jgi:hypothetical protein